MYCSTINPDTKQTELFTGGVELKSEISTALFQEMLKIEMDDRVPYLFEVLVKQDSYEIVSKVEAQLDAATYWIFFQRLFNAKKSKAQAFFDMFSIEALRLLLSPRVNVNNNALYVQFDDSLVGAATGKLVTTIGDAEVCIHKREPFVIAVETLTPDILDVIKHAAGFVTTKVGSTSHAGVIARGRQIPALFINSDVQINSDGISTSDFEIKKFDEVTIDGVGKKLIVGKQDIETLDTDLVLKIVKMFPNDILDKVHVNTEDLDELLVAKKLGVKDIGLFRLEHLIIQNDILETFRLLYLSGKLGVDNVQKQYAKSFVIELSNLLKPLLSELGNSRINVRLLDPPMHEFFDISDKQMGYLAKKIGITRAEVVSTLDYLHEVNPMMGNRGARLLLSDDVLFKAQIDALAGCIKEGTVDIGIEIPFLMGADEGVQIIDRIVKRFNYNEIKREKYRLGVMFEIPSMLYTISELVKDLDFVSFGTNDLTQFMLGLSRDDSDKVIHNYKNLGLVKNSPFKVLDIETVGEIMKSAVRKIRRSNPEIEMLVCGEHGGNFESIQFFRSIGIKEVSCSVGRVLEAGFAMCK